MTGLQFEPVSLIVKPEVGAESWQDPRFKPLSPVEITELGAEETFAKLGSS